MKSVETNLPVFYPRYMNSSLSVDAMYTAFIEDYGKNFNCPGESHDMWELDCILSGTAGITSGIRLFACEAYQLVIHPPGIFHRAWAMKDEGVRILTVSFTGEWLTGMVPTGKFVLNVRERMIVNLLAEKIRECFGISWLHEAVLSRENEQILKTLTELLLLELNLRQDETTDTGCEDYISSRFTEIAAYMKDHILEPLDTDRICADCGIGKSALKELFRRYTGKGAIKYYNMLRIRYAIELLRQGGTMAEIAAKMNFSSQNYFSVFFKRETGMMPSRYRNGR